MIALSKQVELTHYSFSKYMAMDRWTSMWYQMNEILKYSPDGVLEIGKGTGLLGGMLKNYEIDYQSVDIDPGLNPDHVASVTELPFKDNSFDVVVCFQVLEHMPYEMFDPALQEIARVTRQKIIISLPDAKVMWPFSFHIPKVGIINFHIPKPQIRPKNHEFDGQHYWEINKAGYPISRILESMKGVNLQIENSYRALGNQYHHFFVLNKYK